MIGVIRYGLAGGAALVALSQIGAAQAQVQSPGWFGSLTGWYVVDAGSDGTCIFTPGCVANTIVPTRGPGDGWGGSALLGYRFMGNIDIALGGAYVDLSKNNMGIAPANPNNRVTLDARYFSGDVELGYSYSGNQFALRPFVGARYADWRHDHRYLSGGGGAPAQNQVDYWGIGPRIGLDGTVRVSNWLSLFGGVSGSVLFGKIDGKSSWTNFGNTRDKDNRTVWNADGKLGVAFDLAPQVALAAGYRAEYWNGVANDADSTGAVVANNQGSANRFLHGPFVRLSYNIGAPVGAPAPVAQPPVDMKKSFIVFFDFDRSNLTPTALGTIKQAADAAKAGKPARVNVTGHADKSGGDQYNMALSLRRANTVKDELVRQGVPAASIVVVGRGESQPLVPTADGVKEPQNRRVEIVLN